MQEQPNNLVTPNNPAEPLASGTQSTPQAPAPKKRSWLSAKLLVLAALLLVVIGGGGSAYYYESVVPSRPNNVVAKSFEKLVEAKPASNSYDFTSIVTRKADPSNKITVNALVGTDAGSNARADITLSVSAFKFTLSTIARTKDKTVYLKLNELPSLLKLMTGGQSSPAIDNFADKLNKSWLRISVKDLQDAGSLTKSEASKAESCVSALSDYFTTRGSQLRSNLIDAYKQHPFTKATKVGDETVNNIAATKYSLTIDRTALTAFSKAVDDATADSGKSVDAACNSKTPPKPTKKADTKSTPSTIHDTFVWIGKDKSIVKLATGMTSDSSETALELSLGHQEVDTSVPNEVMSYKQLNKEFEKAFGVPLNDLQGDFTQGLVQ